jgi:hypothetical protein
MLDRVCAVVQAHMPLAEHRPLHVPVLSSLCQCVFVQLLLTASNGDVVECSEETGLTQGIAAAPAEEEDMDATSGSAGGLSGADGNAEHPRPRGQDTDAHGFPVKESFFLDTGMLPARVQAATILVSNFSGGGMANVRRFCARVVDATAADPVAMRDIAVFIIPNAKGAHANRSVAAVAIVYKETTGMPLFCKVCPS